MKKFKIKLFALILVISIISVSCIAATAATKYYYEGYTVTELGDDKVAISGWDNRADNLVIPVTILDDYVTEIDDMALINNTTITSVDFSKAYSLDKIGLMAFKGCTGIINDISLPAGVSYMGIGAFQECSSIELLNYMCRCNIPSQCFYKCTSLKEAIIADGVQVIGSNAFAECTSLSKIRIPITVNEIHTTAFSECSNIVIYCYTGSYAQSFAEDNDIEYVLIDASTPTEPVTEPVTEPATEVVTEPATQEPTSATEPSTDPTEPKAPYMLGDADNSGDIDVIDATFVQRYSIDATIPCEDTIMQADVDSSGDVSSIDATFILRHLIHISVGYPIGEYVS